MSTESHRIADRSTLFDRGASPKLINDHQGGGPHVGQDELGLLHLHHERGGVGLDAVSVGDPREDAVRDAQQGGLSRHSAPKLSHDAQQYNLRINLAIMSSYILALCWPRDIEYHTCRK